MATEKKQALFRHGPNWEAAHGALATDAEVWPNLKLDGVILDLEGQLREQRRCPACGSTITGSPLEPKQMVDVLTEHATKLGASLEQVSLFLGRQSQQSQHRRRAADCP